VKIQSTRNILILLVAVWWVCSSIQAFALDLSGGGGGGAGLSGLTVNILPYATSATAITTDTDGPFWDATGNALSLGVTVPARFSTATFYNNAVTVIEDTTDDASFPSPLVIARSRSSATAPGAFGSRLGFQLEGFTNNQMPQAAALTVAWGATQTNDTTDRDSSLSLGTMIDGTFGSRWQVSTASEWLPLADNTYDIGRVATFRPRSIYIGTDANVGGRLQVGGIEAHTGLAYPIWGENPTGVEVTVIVADNNMDTDTAQNMFALRRYRSSSTAPGVGFAAQQLVELEGFTDESRGVASVQRTGWEVAQTNDTTARDSYYELWTMLNNVNAAKWRITSDGHWSSTGADPTLSSCGTTPSVTGSDSAGKITIGTGTVTSCTVTFSGAYATNAPACTVSGDNTAVTYIATTSTTVLTITSSADMATDVVSYQCTGIL